MTLERRAALLGATPGVPPSLRALGLIDESGDIALYIDEEDRLVNGAGIPILIFKTPEGLVGDGVADDGPAINSALATGRAVFLPKPSSYYRIATALVMSATIGQRLLGEDQSTRLVADASVAKILSIRERSQQIENLRISGHGIADGQSGLYIGPNYQPYWKARSLLIDGCGIGIENKCPDSNPGAYGSDAGGIYDCQLETCGIGFLAFGNKDDTPVIGTSFSSCTVAGVKVDGDGGATVMGGVFGGCGTSILVSSGNCTGRGIHFEPDSGASGYSGYIVDVATNSSCTIADSFSEHGAASGVTDIRGDAGSRLDIFGNWGGADKARSNGSCVIRHFGGQAGTIIIDYNGAFTFPAGQFDYVSDGDGLPAAAATYIGLEMAVVGANEKRFYKCRQTGASAFEWVQIGGA